MSVTFTFAQFEEVARIDGPGRETVLVHGIDCRHTCPTPDTCEDYGVYSYCDHIDAARDTCGCQAFDVNVSNANAVLILERLGFATDPSGSTTPDEILGRAMVANVGRDDSGTAATEDRTAAGGCFIDMGVRPGYYDDRMAQIIDLANEAKRRGVMVGWC